MTIDILQLIDRLEELLDRGWRVPVTKRVAIDEDLFLNIIDQMRITIPQDIQFAQEVLRERDRYLAQAQEEAAQLIVQAREDASRQVEHLSVRSEAEAEARRLIREAEREAQRIRAGAEDYAESQLKDLARQVAQLMSTIRNGLEVLEQRRAEWSEQSGAEGAPTGRQAQQEDGRPSDQANNGRDQVSERPPQRHDERVDRRRVDRRARRA